MFFHPLVIPAADNFIAHRREQSLIPLG